MVKEGSGVEEEIPKEKFIIVGNEFMQKGGKKRKETTTDNN